MLLFFVNSFYFFFGVILLPLIGLCYASECVLFYVYGFLVEFCFSSGVA